MFSIEPKNFPNSEPKRFPNSGLNIFLNLLQDKIKNQILKAIKFKQSGNLNQSKKGHNKDKLVAFFECCYFTTWLWEINNSFSLFSVKNFRFERWLFSIIWQKFIKSPVQVQSFSSSDMKMYHQSSVCFLFWKVTN